MLDQHDAYLRRADDGDDLCRARDLKARGVRIPRQRARPVTHFGGG